jgi:tetratricopeptide (TPR) repeat protein
VSAEFKALTACPEHWQLFELVTEGSTELTAHVKAHVESGCATCNGRLSDIQTIERARIMKDEFDAFFDALPSDDAPADEREKFLSQFKRKNRPADRLGRLSFDGRQIAAGIVKIACEQGLDAAKARIAAIESDPSRGYAFLYAAQLAMPKVSSDPAMFVELARALASASRSLPFLKDRGPAQPVCREQVLGEAQLLESNALNFRGLPAEARIAACAARASFVEAGEDSFALALADFFEGSAASFENDERGAWSLLRRAHSEFQIYGQENWTGRAEAALGTVMVHRGRYSAAIRFLDVALVNLHPELDGSSYAQTLVNRGYALVQLGRLDAAKATYAKALLMARRLGMAVSVLMIRTGLASIDLASGKLARALMLFERVGAEARALGLDADVLCSELRIAECMGRMGREQDMLDRIERVCATPEASALRHDPALRELFASVEEKTVSHELLAHVARFIEARDRGVQKGYRQFRLVVNGN